MVINLDLQSDVPIYTQLVNQIMEGMAKQELQPGEALPSVRAMASDLGINLHTVNKAYQQLKHAGFIQIHRQRGVVINPDGVPPADDPYLQKLHGALRPMVAESICRGVGEDEFLHLCRQLYTSLKPNRGDK